MSTTLVTGGPSAGDKIFVGDNTMTVSFMPDPQAISTPVLQNFNIASNGAVKRNLRSNAGNFFFI